ncbi:MAG: formyltetrahydrofolate deformylase [Phycisphaeraceae bacterium]
MPSIKAVVSVSGKDQKGVVARFATYLAEQGVNILDLEQQVVHGRFLMDMLVDLADMSITLDELITGTLEQGKAIGMEVRVSLHDQRRRKRVAVLVSKEAHCLERMIADWQTGRYRGELACVLGNHDTLEPIATRAGLPFASFPSKPDKQAHFDWLNQELATHDVDLIALARYMQIVPPNLVEQYRHKIINIHPSLLPHFPGARPYHQAWEAGVRVAGCTAHFVTEDLDEGPIILQDVFHIDVGHDTAEQVREKGQTLEGRVLSDAVAMALDEKLAVVEDKVVFRPGLTSMLGGEPRPGPTAAGQ